MKAKLNLLIVRLWHELKSDEAQDLIEYALLVGFIALAAIGSMKPIAQVIYGYYLVIKAGLGGLPGVKG